MAIRGFTVAYPLLALGCIVIVLFGIIATVVLALIPLYLSAKTITPNTLQRQLSYSIALSQSLSLGSLSDSELAQLLTTLQLSQTTSTLNSGTISLTSAQVVSGTVADGGRKRRQDFGNLLILVIVITGRTTLVINSIEKHLNIFIQNNPSTIIAEVVLIIESRPSTTTVSTVPSAVLSSTTTIPSIVLSSTTTTIPPGVLSSTTTTIPPGVLSSTTTTIPSGVLSSTATVPSGALSSTTAAPVGRRRRHAYEMFSTLSPLVTYRD